ncbi:MAG: hypothetical protein NXI31_13740 [bacterium]|nr:hypothetical protein [bacterium]
MFQRLLALSLLVFTCSFAAAQCHPPALDDPLHWEIHGPDGSLGMNIEVELLFSEGNVDVFLMATEVIIDGEPVVFISYAFQEWFENETQCEVDVLNGDSGNWTEWHWQGDHFQKVGGTQHQRFFYPIY